MRQGLPIAKHGQTVGLLGGSFDPAHEGHVQITRAALARFNLDRIWWLVTPGNPLKKRGPAPFSARMQAACALMQHPRVTVTDIEAKLGTRYTAQTLAALRAHYPGVRFVWLMGADNLIQFHQWQNWRDIMENVPVGVLARPGDRVAARLSKAARVYRSAKMSAQASVCLARAEAPTWCFVNLPMNAQSSSAIRQRGEWVAPL